MTQPDETQPPPDPLDDPLFGEEPIEEEEKGRVGRVPEFVKKMAIAGLGALFMTEEGIRNLAGQLKLPKEVLGFIVGQAEKTKDDVGRVLSEEIRRFLQSEKLRDEFLKLLSGMTVEIKAEVRLVPDKEKHEGAVAPKLVVSDLGARRSSKKAKKE
ncbi:MAG: hypothetical protein ACYC8T_10315 [Myxococcaceae bacterium]